MADITQTSLLSASNGSAATIFTTASVSPSANKLLLLTVSAQRIGGDPSEPTVAGNGLTWVKVATLLNPASNDGRLTLFRAMGGAPSSGTIVITFSEEQNNATWMLSEFGNVRTSGANGADAVVQSNTQQEGSTTPSVTLSAFEHANNATFGCIQNLNGVFVTEGTGFTEINDIDALACQTQWRNDNDTSVTWTGDNSGWSMIAVEIRNATGAIFHTLLTEDSTDTDGTTFTTASVTPAANTLILLAFHQGSDPFVTVSGVVGNGLTWVQVDEETDVGGNREVTVWRAMGSSPTTGTIVITCTGTATAGHWAVSQFENVDTGGTNGADAVVQTVSNTGASQGSPFTVTLASFSDAANATYGVLYQSSLTGTPTPGSGFTQIAENSSNISSVMNVQWRVDNDTSVDWSYTPTQTVAAIAIEIKQGVASASTSAAGTAGHLGIMF